MEQERNQSQFFADNFYSALNKLPVTDECNDKFRLAITTHHSLASELVDQIFRCIQKSGTPNTIVLIGPNHYLGGASEIVSGKNDWQTPFGVLEVENEAADYFHSVSGIEINDLVVERDHAIAFIVPYIKYYFPNTKIVPILIRHSLDNYEADKFVRSLNRIIDDDTLILGSIDFSHYLTLAQSKVNDEITRKIIVERELSQIYSKGDGNFDSAPGIYSILSLAKVLNLSSTYELNHASSADYTPATQNVTSYFNWLFY